MSREIPTHRPGLASGLGRGHSVLRLQRGDPEDHLHHKCRGIAEPCAAENAEDQELFPDRGGRHEADLLGYPQLRKGLPRGSGMDCGPQSAGHNVRWAFRPLTASDNRVAPIRYTEFQTLPTMRSPAGCAGLMIFPSPSRSSACSGQSSWHNTP